MSGPGGPLNYPKCTHAWPQFLQTYPKQVFAGCWKSPPKRVKTDGKIPLNTFQSEIYPFQIAPTTKINLAKSPRASCEKLVPFLRERHISEVPFSSKITDFGTLNTKRAFRAFLWKNYPFLAFLWSRMCTQLYPSGPSGVCCFQRKSEVNVQFEWQYTNGLCN